MTVSGNGNAVDGEQDVPSKPLTDSRKGAGMTVIANGMLLRNLYFLSLQNY